MMFPRFALTAALAALVGVATADLQVTSPSSNTWWVAKSQNVIAWTCQSSSFQSFTILIANSNPTVLVQPQAIIAIENNFDCSKIITQDQASQAAGTGYTILLANPLNNTDVYATSEPFEIKALGSAYPATSVSVSPSSTGSGAGSGTSAPSSTGSASSDSSKSGASNLKTSIGGIAALAGAALGVIFA